MVAAAAGWGGGAGGGAAGGGGAPLPEVGALLSDGDLAAMAAFLDDDDVGQAIGSLGEAAMQR
jgi:hypothetical protein